MIEFHRARNIWAVFSVSPCPAQSTAGGRKKEKANDELQAGQAGGEVPYQSPWRKNKAVDIEQFWKLHLWLILGRGDTRQLCGNPGLEAPAVEQDLLVVALPWWLQGERKVGGAGRCSSRFLLDTWAAWCSVLDSEWSSMPSAPSSDNELLQRGTSGYVTKYFVMSCHGSVVALHSAAVSAKPGSLHSSFPVGDFCPKYRT